MSRRPAPIKLNFTCSSDTYVKPHKPEKPAEFAPHHQKYFNEHIMPIIKRRNFEEPIKAAEIVEGIWLGDAKDAINVDELITKNITCVVNCAEKNTLTCAEFYPLDWNYIGFECEDSHNYDILGKHLSEFCEFMDMCLREKKGVLVHCVAGINRSATLLIAYLVERRGMSLIDAISLCFQKRPIILTNEAFVMALIERFV
jgi:protein-tyrosine phosphatase